MDIKHTEDECYSLNFMSHPVKLHIIMVGTAERTGKRSFTHLSAQITLPEYNRTLPVCVVWPLWRQWAMDANGAGVEGVRVRGWWWCWDSHTEQCTQVSFAWNAGPLKCGTQPITGPTEQSASTSWGCSTSLRGAATRWHLIKHQHSAIEMDVYHWWHNYQYQGCKGLR